MGENSFKIVKSISSICDDYNSMKITEELVEIHPLVASSCIAIKLRASRLQAHWE